MGVLDGLQEAMASLSLEEKQQREHARAALRQRQETALGAQQAAENDRRLLSATQLLEQRAAGRVWFAGLLKHQWDGMRFGYAAKRWLLGDGMGLGKTRTMIGWLDLIAAKRVIVIAQAEIAPQFAAEIAAVAPHQRLTVLSKKTPAKRTAALNVARLHDGIIVVNFELLRAPRGEDRSVLMQRLIEWKADTVIVDEAHNMKTTASKAYQNVEELVMANNLELTVDSGAPVLPSERLMRTKSVKNLGLTTGTPILNSPEDLYPLLHLIDPTRFPFKKAFTEAFCEINYAAGGKLEFLAHGLERLRPMIAGNFLARSREDAGIVLPPQKRTIVKVEIGADHPDQARVVQQISEHAKIQLQSGEEHTIMHAMAWLTRKRQSVVWPAGIEIRETDKDSPNFGEVIFRVGDDVQESAKLDAVCANIAIEHAKGARQIVFSQFKTALVALEKRLSDAGYNVARFDGDTPSREREIIKTDFYRTRVDYKYDIVLVHYRSGGTGLNLQRATVTHFLDEEWNPGRADQASARTHRMGQEQETEVFIYRSHGAGANVDTWMANLNYQKKRMIESFEGTVDASGSDVYTALRDMIVEDVAA